MAALRGDGAETEPPQPKALLFQQTIEVVKPADSPFPAPLEEGISLDTYSAYIEPLPMLDMEQKVGLAMPPPTPHPHPRLCPHARLYSSLLVPHTTASLGYKTCCSEPSPFRAGTDSDRQRETLGLDFHLLVRSAARPCAHPPAPHGLRPAQFHPKPRLLALRLVLAKYFCANTTIYLSLPTHPGKVT